MNGGIKIRLLTTLCAAAGLAHREMRNTYCAVFRAGFISGCNSEEAHA